MNISILSTEFELDWNKIERDFAVVPEARQVPLYPLIEGAIWQLPALDGLLAALDERVVALEESLQLQGEELARAKRQLKQAEDDLFDARAAFLEAATRLLGGGALDTNRAREAQLQAIGTLWDVEAAWCNRRFPAPLNRARATS